MMHTTALDKLALRLEGDLYTDDLLRALYATDASVYRVLPLAVAVPRSVSDLKQLITFAREQGLSLIPRGAGTSLAGQCVGEGIVVDISKHFNQILEVNVAERWVRVQPGVNRDALNLHLKPLGLFFGPNTSTANRCLIGGMVGNNSCGTTSIVYGSTRDHVLALHTILSDGSEAVFEEVDAAGFAQKCAGEGLEGSLYRHLRDALSDPEQQDAIRAAYPKPEIRRRNTGYAIDLLLRSAPFTPDGPAFNFCQLLCGSEGTLAFTTEIKLHLDPLPPPAEVMLCPHFGSIHETMRAVLVAMQHQPSACELMDKIILDLTKQNIEQQKNRAFVEGDPAAILMIEFRGDTEEEARAKALALTASFRAAGLGFAFPIVAGADTKRVNDLRKAGLGILGNLPGDPKAVACIEDTAVAIADLPAYISDVSDMMAGFGQQPVYYAHAGDGEIHLRPILDLKTSADRQLFYDITEATAWLVKKYNGSLSGEHGDGRVRAAFIPLMVGERNYALLRHLKQTWDPAGIFNPGKIVDAPPMNSALRYEADMETPVHPTVFDFSDTGGILRAAEKCNGSGDCRKQAFSGGTMCPSFQATRDEKDSTRARANALREFLTMNTKANPFDHPEIAAAMDLCLSCKGCTAECPSNVDMATLKAEFLHQYHESNGIPLRSRAIANITTLNRIGIQVPGLSNILLSNRLTSGLLKKALGIAPQRSLPLLHRYTLREWYDKRAAALNAASVKRRQVYLFCDEFTNYNDVAIGEKTVRLLTRLGYEVLMPYHPESGRTHISKGMLTEAQSLARRNVRVFADLVSEETPLLGIEPSAILSFRDEYPRLLRGEEQARSRELAPHCLLVEEFLAREAAAGHLHAGLFHAQARHVLLHGHCHQKALSDVGHSALLLSLPAHYTVQVVPSGCCGMAGSFGYEAEHYELSMQVGELVLFPALRQAAADTLVAASGTSCRHQIKDGTQRKAQHPVEILLAALKAG